MAACALLGVEEVYAVGGAQAIAMFGHGAGPCRPVDLVTGPGNVYVAAAKRLLRGRVGIDSEAGPTEIAVLADDTADAGVRRGRPDQPGRARPGRRERAGDRLRVAGRRRRRRAGQAGRRDPPRRADPDRARPAGSRGSCWSTTSTRAWPSSTPTPPSTSRSTPATPRRSPPGSATPARSSSARTRRCAWATTAPAPTTCCPRRAAPATPAGCRCARSCRSVHVVDYTREALAEVAGHVVALAEAEDLPGHGRAVSIRLEDRPRAPCDDLPSAAGGAARPRALRRPAAPREQAPVQLNVNENPYGPSPEAAADIARAVGGGRGHPATATPTASSSRCAPRWRPTSTATAGRGSRPSRCGRPTAPTR